MTINYVYYGQPMTGDEDGEFFIAYSGSTGTSANTVNAGAGNDWVMGDSSDTWIPSASNDNDSIADAFSLETITGTWTTDENPLFGSSGTPHTTAIVEATIGQSEFFKVSIGAGQTITIDIDFAFGSAVGSRDLIVELRDGAGNVLATGDDSSITQGGLGSFSNSPGSTGSYDPYLTYTPASAGDYYINVRPFGGGTGSTFTANDIFLLNVSVAGHATSASPTVMGADTIDGGEGHDYLFGQGAADVINGSAGDDLIHGGSGVDVIHGGLGNDTVHGGEGTEEDAHGDEGNDILRSGGEGHYYGDDGDDTIYAGLTSGINEVLDGGTGIDTVDTTSWNGSYAVNLATGATTFGEIFSNFESITSGNGNDAITGTAGNNIIITQGGNDIVQADGGDDTVAGGADGDNLDGGAGIDTLDYRTSVFGVTVTLATNSASGGDATGDTILNFENVTGSNAGDTLSAIVGGSVLIGNAGTDTLTGNDGNDTLNGGFGADTMTGGLGNDIYFVDSIGDVFNEQLGEGTDTLAIAFSHSIASNLAFENLVTIDAAGTISINLTGNELANSITGNNGANVLIGGAGADTLNGGGGIDTLNYTSSNAGVTVSLAAGTGSGGHAAGDVLADLENVTGSLFADTLTGDAGANLLIGGAGADTLNGLGGNDVFYVDNASDVIVESAGAGAGGGVDRVYASVSYVLGAAAQVEILSTTNNAGTGAINLTGNGFVNSIVGNDGANVLNGGAGVDTLNGLGGDDFFHIDNVGDVIVEAAGGGSDRVYATVSYTLGSTAQVETLTTTNSAGTGAINFTGNAFVNSIAGNNGANVLNGGAGADTLNGLGGNDSFHVDNVGDVIVEAAGGGNDRVYASVSYALSAATQVEILSTTNNADTTAINLTGNGFANSIVGNNGANILSGGAGADTLNGLGGNDSFYVDNVGDVVVEAAGGGNDRVYASVSYTLASNAQVETLTTTDNAGTGAINLTGNGFVNSIAGNYGSNVLNGGAGADTLNGLGGDDFFYVDNAGDVIVEVAGDGSDRVYASVSYVLGAAAQVEILSTTNNAGTGAINLTGNALVNSIVGNNGNNLLNGGVGADTLNGLSGDDSLYVDQFGDVVIEAAGGGNDRIFASSSYAVGAGVHVETLSTTNNAGLTSINLAGNELANSIAGNAGANVLDGGLGNDTLNGLGGADTFRFTAALGAGNIDTIAAYVVADDKIEIDNAVFTGLAAGALAAGTFRTGAAAADADDRIIYNSATGALLFDADGNGAGAAVQFATLSAGLAMAAGEFAVI